MTGDSGSVTVSVCRDEVEVGERAAALVLAALAVESALVLGVATGSTPLPAYRVLVAARGRGVDFSRVRCVALDEYVGLEPADPASYHSYLRTLIARPLGIPASQVVVPSGDGSTLERVVAGWGGVDVQLLGIGRNGHLGFNEPGSDLASRTRVVALSETTRRDNARFFARPQDVPGRAITQGLATIAEARHLVLLASGEGKAEAVAAALHGPVTERVPASVLQRHPHVTVLLDDAAAALLGRPVPSGEGRG